MKHPLRAVSALTMTVVVYYGFVLVCPERSHVLGLDIWNYFKEKKDLDESVRRSAEFEMVNRRMVKIALRKEAVARDLIDGRITLLDASEQFLTLNREYPRLMTQARSNYPSTSDEESCAMQVIRYIHVCAMIHPKAPPEVVTRLEVELKDMRELRSKKLD